MRTRRVGSISCGSIMVVFGILFMVHMFYPALSLNFIMKLWPVILIVLGLEMVVATVRNEGRENELIKYDKGAIFITLLLTVFSLGMGIAQFCVEQYVQYGPYYY